MTFIILLAFLVNGLMPARAELFLPPPGQMVALSPAFCPPVLKGLKVYPKDPLKFDFILDKGDDKSLSDQQVRADSTRLIKYFLASLTIPEKDLWVNLSPYEKDRIIPEAFGKTEMGRDLLAQDYILKQITSSLLYPEGETGKAFWKKVYALAQEKYGTTDIPVDTFNKVWIVPDKAVVYENAKVGAVYITGSRLKVMLEQDYVAEQRSNESGIQPERSEGSPAFLGTGDSSAAGLRMTSDIAKSVLRDIVIPVLEKEVNEGKNFAQLRQVYQSLILATWFKRKVTQSLLSAAYIDQQKIGGVRINDSKEGERIWGQYVQSFRRGICHLVKEEKNEWSETIARKYFIGGAQLGLSEVLKGEKIDFASLPDSETRIAVKLHALNPGKVEQKRQEAQPNFDLAEQGETVTASHHDVDARGRISHIDWPEGSRITGADFYYDWFDQIERVSLSLRPQGNEVVADIPVGEGGKHFNFSYKDNVPVIYTADGERRWYFSGYQLGERMEGSDEETSRVTIKSFRDGLLAYESDSHDSMYYFLMELKNLDEGLRLVNFDLHHDIYYNQGEGQSSRVLAVNYTNWVRKAKEKGYVRYADWVIPRWYNIPDEVREDAVAEGWIDQIVRVDDLFGMSIQERMALTIDFDYFDSINIPQKHRPVRGDILSEVQLIRMFVRNNRKAVVGVNFNRSAFSGDEEHNCAPKETSLFILNALVSAIAEDFGAPVQIKTSNGFSFISAITDVHPELFDVARERQFDDQIVEAKAKLRQSLFAKSGELFSRTNIGGYLFLVEGRNKRQLSPWEIAEIRSANLLGGEVFANQGIIYIGTKNLGMIERVPKDATLMRLETYRDMQIRMASMEDQAMKQEIPRMLSLLADGEADKSEFPAEELISDFRAQFGSQSEVMLGLFGETLVKEEKLRVYFYKLLKHFKLPLTVQQMVYLASFES